MVTLENKDDESSVDDPTFLPQTDGCLEWGLAAEDLHAAKLGLLKSSRLLLTNDSRTVDRELLQDFALNKLDYSGIAEPAADAAVTAADFNSTLSG